MPITISVVIATRNRAPQLAKCIRHFQKLDLTGVSDWELILVDNGSTDNTAQVVENLKADAKLPITYVFEPKAGLSKARNAGVRAAKYEIIAFTDDDCLVDPGWLAAISTVFHEEPNLAMVGGRVELHDPRDYEISVRRFLDRTGIATLDDLFDRLIGCNMAMSAAAIRNVGDFDTSLGAGAAFEAGEDHDYFYRMLKRGGKILYDPRILIEHAHGRRAGAEIQALKSSYLQGRAAIFAKHIRAGDRGLIKRVYWELCALLRTGKRADGSQDTREFRFFGIYTFHLLRGLLVLR